MPISKNLSKYLDIIVYGSCSLAAFLTYGLWFINGRDSGIDGNVFFFRAALIMTIVYCILCCLCMLWKSNLPLTLMHTSVFFVSLTYAMGLFLLISSILIIETFDGKFLYDYIEMEIYDFPGLFYVFGIVGVIISLVLLIYAAFLTYLVLKAWKKV